jgi:hypothetical protein
VYVLLRLFFVAFAISIWLFISHKPFIAGDGCWMLLLLSKGDGGGCT